jgi:hypothetical protein
MSRSDATLGLYRRAVRLYPRRFRDDYGRDLVLLVADQLRDEPPWRVAARNAIDLVLTLPTRHLEAHMNRPPTALVPTILGAIALSAVIVGITVGHPLVLLVCLAIAIAAGGLGLLAVHRARPLTQPRPTSAHWWRLLAGGAGLMAALIGITTITGELPDGAWLVAMITGLTAIVLMSAGVVLGIAHLASRPSRGATT